MVVRSLVKKFYKFLDPVVMIRQCALVFVKQILLPNGQWINAFPDGHPAIESSPMSGTDQWKITVLFLGVVQIGEPLRPETGHVKIVVVILSHHVARPANPFRPIGRVLRKSLQAAGQGPVNIAVNAVDEIIGAGKVSRLRNGVTYVPAFQVRQCRGPGITSHCNIAKPM